MKNYVKRFNDVVALMHNQMKGRTIESVLAPNLFPFNFVRFEFTDGTSLDVFIG